MDAERSSQEADDEERDDSPREDPDLLQAQQQQQQAPQQQPLRRPPPGPPEEYGHVARVRRQHRLNLRAVLRHAVLTRDYSAAAGAAAALLACQPESLELSNIHVAAGGEYGALVELLWTTLEVLRQHATAPEQVRRMVRKTSALLVNEPSMRQAAQLELVLAYWSTDRPDDLRQAHDLLQHELARAAASPAAGGASSRSFAFHLALLAACVKYKGWREQLLGGSVGGPGRLGAAAGRLAAWPAGAGGLGGDASAASRRQQRRLEQLGPLQVPWRARHDAMAVGAGGGDGALDAYVRDLKRANGIFPAAALPCFLLCHALVVADRADEAVSAARAAVAASGRSAEALSLLALLQQPQVLRAAGGGGGGGGEGSTPAAHDHAALCLEVLGADPWALGAVQDLIQQSGHCSHCAAHAAQGLLAHMDAALLECAAGGPASPAQLWPALSSLLLQLAAEAAMAAADAAGSPAPAGAADAAAAEAEAAAQGAAPRRASNGSGGAGSSDSAGAGAGPGSPAACNGEAAAGEAPQQRWLQLQECFAERRCWWTGAGVADAQEILAAFPPHGTQQQQQQQRSCDQGLDSDGTPSTSDSLMGSGGGGGGQVAAEGPNTLGELQLQMCCKAVALAFVLGPANAYSQAAAAALAAGAVAAAPAGGEAAAPSAAAACDAVQDALALAAWLLDWDKTRQRQRRQQQQQQHRLLGAPTAMFGAMLDMPEAWWACFPERKRQRRRLQAEAAAAAAAAAGNAG